MLFDIGHGQVSDKEVSDGPAGWIFRPWVDSNSEKSKLEAEWLTDRRFQVSCVIPPFDLVFRVTGVVPGKVELVSGECLTPLIALPNFSG